LIFVDYAADLVNRLALKPATSILEIAAGTGVVTRNLASLLPETVSIIATDQENEFIDTVTTALGTLFPDDPPRFMARIPHGYHDHPTIKQDLANGGFTASPQISTLAKRSRATSSQIPAIAYCQGTPLRNEIEARDAPRLGEATELAAEAIAQRFGRGAVDGKIQAHVITIEN